MKKLGEAAWTAPIQCMNSKHDCNDYDSPPMEVYKFAATTHDYLCWSQKYPRE